MDIKHKAQEVASKGRFGDTTLVHMNPVEVAGIASLTPNGLSTNPDTGYPEAFAFLLPLLGALGAAAPAAAGAAGAGAAAGLAGTAAAAAPELLAGITAGQSLAASAAAPAALSGFGGLGGLGAGGAGGLLGSVSPLASAVTGGMGGLSGGAIGQSLAGTGGALTGAAGSLGGLTGGLTSAGQTALAPAVGAGTLPANIPAPIGGAAGMSPQGVASTALNAAKTTPFGPMNQLAAKAPSAAGQTANITQAGIQAPPQPPPTPQAPRFPQAQNLGSRSAPPGFTPPPQSPAGPQPPLPDTGGGLPSAQQGLNPPGQRPISSEFTTSFQGPNLSSTLKPGGIRAPGSLPGSPLGKQPVTAPAQKIQSRIPQSPSASPRVNQAFSGGQNFPVSRTSPNLGGEIFSDSPTQGYNVNQSTIPPLPEANAPGQFGSGVDAGSFVPGRAAGFTPAPGTQPPLDLTNVPNAQANQIVEQAIQGAPEAPPITTQAPPAVDAPVDTPLETTKQPRSIDPRQTASPEVVKDSENAFTSQDFLNYGQGAFYGALGLGALGSLFGGGGDDDDRGSSAEPRRVREERESFSPPDDYRPGVDPEFRYFGPSNLVEFESGGLVKDLEGTKELSYFELEPKESQTVRLFDRGGGTSLRQQQIIRNAKRANKAAAQTPSAPEQPRVITPSPELGFRTPIPQTPTPTAPVTNPLQGGIATGQNPFQGLPPIGGDPSFAVVRQSQQQAAPQQYQEGGEVMQTEGNEGDQALIVAAAEALQGQGSPQAIEAFVQKFGQRALQDLKKRMEAGELDHMFRTDGTSDDIRATIDGEQEARLSTGEFVVPADVVSGLGNGDTNAGTKRLHEMMGRVRQLRTGQKAQAKEINPAKVLPS